MACSKPTRASAPRTTTAPLRRTRVRVAGMGNAVTGGNGMYFPENAGRSRRRTAGAGGSRRATRGGGRRRTAR